MGHFWPLFVLFTFFPSDFYATKNVALTTLLLPRPIPLHEFTALLIQVRNFSPKVVSHVKSDHNFRPTNCCKESFIMLDPGVHISEKNWILSDSGFICFQIETYVYQINCNSRDLMVALLEWFAPYLLLWWFLNPFKVSSTFGGRQVAQWIRHFINGLLQAWVQIHTPFTFSGFIWSTLHSIVLFCICLYLNCENEQKIEKNWPRYVGQ